VEESGTGLIVVKRSLEEDTGETVVIIVVDSADSVVEIVMFSFEKKNSIFSLITG